MPWLFLLLAVAAFVIALSSSSVAIVAVCLLASLAGMVMWIMGLLAQRVGNSARSDVMLIDPQELRRLREQAEAKRGDAISTHSATPTSPATGESPQA